MLLNYHISLLENFRVFVLEILKTNLLSHNLSKCNFVLNFDFHRFYVYL